jgi:hypothetical protein
LLHAKNMRGHFGGNGQARRVVTGRVDAHSSGYLRHGCAHIAVISKHCVCGNIRRHIGVY